jgi:hypothetical protein
MEQMAYELGFMGEGNYYGILEVNSCGSATTAFSDIPYYYT